MAGTLTVQNIEGPSSGSDANKVIIPSGQTLYAPGHVLQVVSAEDDTTFNTTSTSFSDTSLTASITPISTSSKVLVIVQNSLLSLTSTTNGSGVEARVTRNGTAIGKKAMAKVRENLSTGNTSNVQGAGSLVVFDSPSSTSSVTYRVQTRSRNSAVTAAFNTDDSGSTITLMEIAQ